MKLRKAVRYAQPSKSVHCKSAMGLINGSDGPEVRLPFYPWKRTLRVGPAVSVTRQQVTFETKEAAEIPVIGPSASSEGVYHQFGFSVHGFALAI